jgi:hypothetical protein
MRFFAGVAQARGDRAWREGGLAAAGGVRGLDDAVVD